MIRDCRLFFVRRVAVDVAASVVFLFCAANADAQASRVGAAVEGIVSDATGAVIPNAQVALHNPLTNQARRVSTDGQGFFRAEQLAVGTYEVGVEQAGPAVSGSTPLTGSGFTFGGLRPRSNNVSIDGLDNNDEYSGSSRTELSPEIVQEFQVVNNGLSAESGGASGGSINVITRSGTNTIHGDAFLFAQDGALNARAPFETQPRKPSFRRFRGGFALSGPILKDRTFYYAAVEQEHNRGQIGSDVDPTVTSTINSFLAAGAFPGFATRQVTRAFSPTARAETEAAGKLNHQLTKSTALMLRYTFT